MICLVYMSCDAYKKHNSNNKFSKALISTMLRKCNNLSESA